MANIKIKLIKSSIGSSKKQALTLKSLRLTKLNKVVELPDNPQIRGMIKKVPHLVKIVNEEQKLDFDHRFTQNNKIEVGSKQLVPTA